MKGFNIMKKREGSIISSLLALIVLYAIFKTFATQIIIAIIIIVIIIIIGLIVKSKLKKSGNIDLPSETNTGLAEKRKWDIKRQVEILTDCINLINSSKNLDVVIYRYNSALKAIEHLSEYTDSEIQNSGFNLRKGLNETKQELIDNKIQIFNRAISDNIEKVSVLKTETKTKHVKAFFDKYYENDELPAECKTYLYEQYRNAIPQKYVLVDEITHTKKTATMSPDGKMSFTIENDSFIKDYFDLSTIITSSKDRTERLDACEKSYSLLKEFCRYCLEEDIGELPPVIACRDTGPRLYMLAGEWNKAEAAIKKCIEANAYYPDNGSDQLTYLNSYKEVATEALAYIEQNPGCLQRNMYKVMSYEDDKKEILKYFLRYSEQIKKVKHGNTNELYVKAPEKR